MATILPKWLETVMSTYRGSQHDLHWLAEEGEAPPQPETLHKNFDMWDLHIFKQTPAKEVFDLDDLPFSDEYKDKLLQELSRYLVVGKGPRALGRGWSAKVCEGVFCVNLEQPDQLWLALSRYYPPSLWIPLGQTPETIDPALSTYFLGKNVPAEETFTGICRVYMGSARELNMDLSELENRFTISLFCEELQWGNSCPTDPYTENAFEQGKKEDLPGPSLLAYAAIGQETTAQERGWLASTSFRSFHSKSVIKIEDHERFFVAEIRYRPATQQTIVEQANQLYDLDFPVDIPLDVLTTLLGMPIVDASHLGPAPGEPWPETRWKISILYIMGVVGGEGLRRKFRTLMADPDRDVRWLAATIARWRKHPDLLQEMYEAEQDEELRASLQAALHSLSSDQQTETKSMAEAAEGPLERVRLPLKPVYREQMMATAWSDEWLWLKTIEANDDPDKGPICVFEMIWSTSDRKTFIHYIEDNMLCLTYLLVKGKETGAIVTRLREELPVYHFEEIRFRLLNPSNAEDACEAICLLGLNAPATFSEQHFILFRHSLADPNAQVRQTTILAMAYAGWPAFLDLLTQVALSDSDQGVRQQAQILMENMQRQQGEANEQ